MDKVKIDGFIDRYSLGGEVESVKLESENNNLSVRIITGDKQLLGEVKVNGISFPNGEFGIYTTSQLKAMLGVLDSEVSAEVVQQGDRPEAIIFSDNGAKVQYMLAELKVIPSVPDLKILPEFDVNIQLDASFIQTFGRSTGALKKAKTFTFISKDGKSQIVLGYSTNNSNRISIDVNADVDGDISPISFNAEYLKAILDANKEAEDSSMKISTDGLCNVEFSDEVYKSSYYLTQIK